MAWRPPRRSTSGSRTSPELTPAQAALLAGLPKSPSTLDPYRYAEKDKQGRLVVPADSPPVVRRDWILDGLGEGSARWTRLTPTEIAAAKAEPVILAGDQPLVFKAAHFTWQVRRQLVSILGDEVAVETGGYKVITTLDWKAQQLAEKWLAAGAVVPNLPRKKGEAPCMGCLRVRGFTQDDAHIFCTPEPD